MCLNKALLLKLLIIISVPFSQFNVKNIDNKILLILVKKSFFIDYSQFSISQ